MGIDMKQDFEDLFILPSRSHGSNGSAVDPEIGSTHGDISELPKDVQEQRVIGDTVRIAQILRCFLSNAIKFTPQGGTFTFQDVLEWSARSASWSNQPLTPWVLRLVYRQDYYSRFTRAVLLQRK